MSIVKKITDKAKGVLLGQDTKATKKKGALAGVDPDEFANPDEVLQNIKQHTHGSI